MKDTRSAGNAKVVSETDGQTVGAIAVTPPPKKDGIGLHAITHSLSSDSEADGNEEELVRGLVSATNVPCFYGCVFAGAYCY